jgi:hypothetical protein
MVSMRHPNNVVAGFEQWVKLLPPQRSCAPKVSGIRCQGRKDRCQVSGARCQGFRKTAYCLLPTAYCLKQVPGVGCQGREHRAP